VNDCSEGTAITRPHGARGPSAICETYVATHQTEVPSQQPVVAQTSATLFRCHQNGDFEANISATGADCSFPVHCDAVRSLSTPSCSHRGPIRLSLSSRASDDRTPGEHPRSPPDQRPLRPPKSFQALPSNHRRITRDPKKDVPVVAQHATGILEICLHVQKGRAAQTS